MPNLNIFENKIKKTFETKSNLLIFGKKIYFLLVENFPQTYFTGGLVRNILLNKKVTDIDITTSAKPDEVVFLLKKNNINYVDTYKMYGVVTAIYKTIKIEIATFRQDTTQEGRYGKVKFVNSPKQDSKRRDFTINSLYLSLKPFKILDFNSGLNDLKYKKLKFIGKPQERITQDPLRIIRGLRFALDLNLKINSKTKQAIKNNLVSIQSLTKTKIKNEINKSLTIKNKKNLEQALFDKKFLDKHFK